MIKEYPREMTQRMLVVLVTRLKSLKYFDSPNEHNAQPGPANQLHANQPQPGGDAERPLLKAIYGFPRINREA